jgi:hypothetical protein
MEKFSCPNMDLVKQVLGLGDSSTAGAHNGQNYKKQYTTLEGDLQSDFPRMGFIE